MKIAIIGSRSFNNYALLGEILNDVKDRVTLIVSGGANGADKFGERWAKEFKKKTKIFLPDWNAYGKAAGPIRNEKIVKEADVVLAFWDGESRGTKNAIETAQKLNKEVIVIEYKSLEKQLGEVRKRRERDGGIEVMAWKHEGASPFNMTDDELPF